MNWMNWVRRLSVALFTALVLFLGIMSGIKIQQFRIDNTNNGGEIIFLITAIAIMIVSMINDRLFDKSARNTLDTINTTYETNWKSMTKWITANLSPMIISLDTREELLKEAVEVIKQAVNEPTETNRFIVY